ncbi:MAG TPA: glycoside hydrolase family 88 protein [Edaphobacter sp.]|nr:glycoside hydrolase family 88 protein [Edaphobacter sp.]
MSFYFATAAILFTLVDGIAVAQRYVPANQVPWDPGIGDTPKTVPPLANLSASLSRPSVAKAMRKVGDWELHRSRVYFDQDWTFAALYAGFMAASKSLPHAEYESAMLQMGKSFEWKLGPRLEHADDQAVGQTYIALYRDYHEPKMIAPIRKQFDALMKAPDDPAKAVWWWCDALFMAPPVWAELSSVTRDPGYLNYMDREWWITYNLLYDRQEHLYSRDASFLNKREKNGKKLFWSRGNGWAIAGLARVLAEMPADYSDRAKYAGQFRDMAAKIASLQGKDGLWRPGLLDQSAYPLPEVSGSGFFVYALAWGINNGILDRAVYLPVVEKGWAGLLSHVYSDGRLGSIQPVGAAPGEYKASSSYVYGVGAFLLAGSEILHLKETTH